MKKKREVAEEEDEERKTDTGWGPSRERRNTPSIDKGEQKCTDYRRVVA